MPLDRRDLLKCTLVGTAAATLAQAEPADEAAATNQRAACKVIDVNVSLFQWPFRRLPYDSVDELVGKLRALQIHRAWAGSYEGVLHRDLGGVNRRLAEACRKQGAGLLIPFGSINPELPDWEEDLRCCHEEHRMPGIRLHPNYHGYTLDDPPLRRLLAMAAERGLVVQLAASMEDQRTQHPKLQVPDVDLSPLPDLLRNIADAKIVVLNYRPRGELFSRLAESAGIYFDIARVEATDGVARLVRSVPAGRVVFGTHAPFFIYESALIKVYESELTEAESLAVFQENAQRIVADSPAG